MSSWRSLSRSALASIAAGAIVILVVTAVVGWTLMRSEQSVLFSDMRAQDAAVITAELEKLKIPYTLGSDGSSVLVDGSSVHAIRLKLMGKDLPLHGSVGFELFNHTDFGMTEFAQKINYQRALQGELTRTILSFSEIRDARVHLALPDQGLFKQNVARPKAAITVSLRQGQTLRPDQVSGIQRLVAAAVPGLSAAEVTIVDHRGLAMTRVTEALSEGVSGHARLDLKRDTETYLSRKVDAVLERAFGPGQAISSVDVTLNMDQVRVTTEDVLGTPDAKGGHAAGVLVREREAARDTAGPEPRGADARAQRGSSVQRDVEYQAGRRVEHVVSQPGAIRRLHVVAVVRQALDTSQREQAERLVAAAAGASVERGDTVVVQLLQGVPAAPPPPTEVPEAAVQAAPDGASMWLPWALAFLVLGFAALFIRREAIASRPVPMLDSRQRQAALERVQAWLVQPEGPSTVKREFD